MKKTILLVTLILFGSTAGLAQKKMYEPKKGSAERSAMIAIITAYDVARNDDLKGEKFDVTAIKVHANWAFVSVERSNLPEAGQGTHLAFLQKSGTKWKVVWSDFNDNQEVGVDALARLRKKNKDFSKALADFAMTYLAG